MVYSVENVTLDPFTEGRQSNFDRVAFLESTSIPLQHNSCLNKGFINKNYKCMLYVLTGNLSVRGFK